MEDRLINQVPIGQIELVQLSHLWDTVDHLTCNARALHLHPEWSNHVINRLNDFLASHVGPRDYSVLLIVLLSTDDAFDRVLKDLARAPHQLIVGVRLSSSLKLFLIPFARFLVALFD